MKKKAEHREPLDLLQQWKSRLEHPKVPAGYFEQLPLEVLNKVKNKRPARIIPFPRRFIWAGTWAVAAALAFVLLSKPVLRQQMPEMEAPVYLAVIDQQIPEELILIMYQEMEETEFRTALLGEPENNDPAAGQDWDKDAFFDQLLEDTDSNTLKEWLSYPI